MPRLQPRELLVLARRTAQRVQKDALTPAKRLGTPQNRRDRYVVEGVLPGGNSAHSCHPCNRRVVVKLKSVRMGRAPSAARGLDRPVFDFRNWPLAPDHLFMADGRYRRRSGHVRASALTISVENDRAAKLAAIPAGENPANRGVQSLL